MNPLRSLLYDGVGLLGSLGESYLEAKLEGSLWAVTIETVLKMLFVFAIMFSFAPILVWAERRQSAMIQDRLGPVRANLRLSPRFRRVLENVQGAGVLVLVAFVAMLASFSLQAHLAEWWLTGDELASYAETGAVPWDFTGLFVVGPVLGLVVALGALAATIYVRRVDGNITIFGLLHPIADALKMMFKEDFVPPKADKLLHAVAPILAVTTAIATFAVIPFADILHISWLGEVIPGDGHLTGPTVPMQVASVNVGILFVFAVAGTGVIGAAIAGYSSDNKYALLGGLRAASQMVSYEVTLGLTIVPAFMVYGTLLLEDMVAWQTNHVWGLLIFPVMTLSAILFFAASIAETKRIPFDLPEGESELVAGYFTEYSGMKFGLFFMGEFIEVVVLAAIFTTLFLGGYDVPFLARDGFEAFGWYLPVAHWGVTAIQMLTFVVKIAVVVWFQLMVRWTLPRFRYDQLMNLCWKIILPVSLVNIVLTGVGILLAPRFFPFLF